MNKAETLKIVVTIENLFNNALTRNYRAATVNITEEQILADITKTYYEALKEFEFEAVKQNLISYSLANSFAPKLADLVKGLNVNKEHNIPNVAETKRILDEEYKPVPKEQQLTKEQINELMLKTLGRGLKSL